MNDLLRRAGGWVRPPSRRQLRTFVSLTVATQVEAVLSFLGTAVLIRVAGTETSGQVFFAQAVASVWFMLWDPRLEHTTQRFVPIQQAGAAGNGTALFLRLVRLDVVIGVFAAGSGAACVLLARSCDAITTDQALFMLITMIGSGATAPMGTIGAGFAISGLLDRLGVLRAGAAACSFTASLLALIAVGPAAYLTAGALSGLVMTITVWAFARQAVTRTLGRPSAGPIPASDGIVRFTLKSSAATSVAAVSDNGVLALAGIFGGPSLVTFLKVAGAAGRLYVSLVSAASAQIYPRMASAAAIWDQSAIRRDALRASTLLALSGAAVLLLAFPLAGPALTIAYGPTYTWLAGIALILLGASCVRGTVVWGKVFPMAVGKPGVQLGIVTLEGLLSLAVLVIATWSTKSPEEAMLRFAWGDVLLATARVTAWLTLLRVLTAPC